MKTNCSCGSEMIVDQSKKSVFCPDCDRTPKPMPSNGLDELGEQIKTYSKTMDKVFELFDEIFKPIKQCQGGCGKSFPEEIMHSGIWCTECYKTTNKTNNRG